MVVWQTVLTTGMLSLLYTQVHTHTCSHYHMAPEVIIITFCAEEAPHVHLCLLNNRLIWCQFSLCSLSPARLHSTL